MYKGILYKKLPPNANPIEWESPNLDWPDWLFKQHRNIHCAFYGQCLNVASELRWESWTCRWCRINPYRFIETQKDLIYIERMLDEENISKSA